MRYSTSGKPASEVIIDKAPANSEAEANFIQSTSDISADTPIVAAAVWATVFTALTNAALIHVLFNYYTSCPFINQVSA